MICQELGDITDPSTAILMNSPGPGILADEMLKQGAKSLHLFETNPEYYYYLAVIKHFLSVNHQKQLE